MVARYWENVARLDRYSHRREVLAINQEERLEGKILGPHPARTTPEQRDRAWGFLGFDVTDPGISGLSNCGYDDAERESLAAAWARRLNRYHQLLTQPAIYRSAAKTEAILATIVIVSFAQITRVGAAKDRALEVM